MGVTVLFRVVKQGLPNMVTFGQRPEGSERVKRNWEIGMGKTCKLKDVSFQCMIKKKKKKKKAFIYNFGTINKKKN